MEIKVAFYHGKGNFINKLVRWWTKSDFSHAELILPDGITWVGISPFKTSKISAVISPIYDESDWKFVSIKVNEKQLYLINQFFEMTKGCRYDWWGMILSHLFPLNIKRKGKWYCSEWIAYALRISNVVKWDVIKVYDRNDISPAKLYKILNSEFKVL